MFVLKRLMYISVNKQSDTWSQTEASRTLKASLYWIRASRKSQILLPCPHSATSAQLIAGKFGDGGAPL